MIKSTVALVLCALSGAVAAQTMPNEQLSQVKSETVLLKAKADEAAALKAVSEALGRSAPAANGAQARQAVAPEEVPTVIGVFGQRGATYAKVSMPNGQRVNARAGELLPGGKWRVDIKGDAVRLVPASRGRR